MSSNPAEPIRLALVGTGLFAQDAHLPAIKALGNRYEIVAIYSRSRANAEALAARVDGSPTLYTDLDALLRQHDVEAVDLILPIEVLPDAVEKSLKAGKHVISEKPITPDVATGRRLIQTYTREYADQVWMVAENWRYEDAFRRAGEIVSSGEIGAVVVVQWTLLLPTLPGNKYYGTNWRRSGTFPGGFLLDGGVHHVAALRQVVGEIASVSAQVRQARPDLPPADTLSAALQFENGVIGDYTVTYAAGAPFPTYLTVVGENGVIRVNRGVVEVSVGEKVRSEDLSACKNVNGELAAFADTIREGKPHRNPPIEALRDVAVIEAMLKSAQNGTRMEVDHFDDLEMPQ